MKVNLLIIILLLAAITAAAQIDNFAFRREIRDARPGWSRIVLPDEIYAKIGPTMTDIRIAGIRSNGERFEVPYLLRQTAETVENQVNFKIINTVRGNGGHLITFEVPTQEAVNMIDLSFSVDDFDWRVKLEGSNDQREWFGIADNYRIVAIRNNFTSYSFTTVRFPDAKFKYLRLFVPSADDPKLSRASILRRTENSNSVRKYGVRSFKVTEDKAYRVSTIDLELNDRVPMSAIRMRVRNTIDFYRPVSVEYQAGKDAEGREIYKRGAADILSSFDPEGFRFPVFAAAKLRITISNQDSPPLEIEGFDISGSPFEVVAQFPENARYYLIYGKPDTPRPQYDIENFKDKIPDLQAELALGDEEVSGDAAPASQPWMSSPIWLWSVMIAAIALIGFFAIRMLRRE